jgi:hypothetical protein
MDDFRVGSVPSAEPYGDRHTYSTITRKRQKRHDDADGGNPDEAADTFAETAEAEESAAAPDEQVEDYYLPSGPAEDE